MDPFHYVDNGVGLEAVAVVCCDADETGIAQGRAAAIAAGAQVAIPRFPAGVAGTDYEAWEQLSTSLVIGGGGAWLGLWGSNDGGLSWSLLSVADRAGQEARAGRVVALGAQDFRMNGSGYRIGQEDLSGTSGVADKWARLVLAVPGGPLATTQPVYDLLVPDLSDPGGHDINGAVAFVQDGQLHVYYATRSVVRYVAVDIYTA